MTTTRWRATCAALALAALLPALPAAAQTTDNLLIPRSAIFGNPERAGASISPDGTYISFLAPRDGVMNVWVVERGKPLSEARPLSSEKVRPIRQHFWSWNGEDILYVQVKGGDENFLLYAVNAKTGVERKLTDFEGVRVIPFGGSKKRPDEMLIGINNRDKAWHDPHLLNIRTGELTKLFDNTDRWSGFTADDSLTIRFVERATPDGGSEVFAFDNGKTTPFTTIGFEDSQTTGLVGLTGDGRTLYMTESRDRNTAALVAIDVASGDKRVIGEDARADVGGVLTDPETETVLAYGVNYLKNEWRPVDDSVKADFEFLASRLKGEWAVQSQTRNGRIWLIGNDPVTEPGRVWVYDRDAKSLDLLYVGRPALEGQPLPQMCPVEIKAADGKILPSYVTLPVGSDPDGDCKPNQPLPTVLNVHGGPWARDGFGYDAEAAWLANRGYASLQVNFRGSTGFGKDFVNAADGEWGAKMHTDLIDAVNWAIAEGIAQKDKVAIYGGSYGGYATLWGMTNTPEAFACGVAVVAPSNLNTLLSTIPPYWEAFKAQMFRRVGNPETAEGQAFLNERSPLTHVQNIRRPLLIAQGANDPRVKQAEADQIVDAMKAKNIPVTYVLYPDEGHGFARPQNRTSNYAITEAFLSECLGGRFEPVGEDFKGSSVTVPHGAEFVPGLKEALSTASN